MALIAECRIFKLSESLYQFITIDNVQVETIVTNSGEWECTITDTYTNIVLNTPLYELTDEVLFQYSTIISSSTIDYIMSQHESLRDLLLSLT